MVVTHKLVQLLKSLLRK